MRPRLLTASCCFRIERTLVSGFTVEPVDPPPPFSSAAPDAYFGLP